MPQHLTPPIKELLALSRRAPEEESALSQWVGQRDLLEFLESNARDPETVLYASMGHLYLHSVLVPAALLSPPDMEDLRRWDTNPTNSWSVWEHSSPHEYTFEPPLAHSDSKTISRGEQLFFSRDFEGLPRERKHYYELSQKFAHISQLHFVSERNAYCRIDRLGDIVEIVRVLRLPAKPDEFPTNMITVDRATLDQYMALTETSLVRLFDFVRAQSPDFYDWPGKRDEEHIDRGDIHYKLGVYAAKASYARGFQIIRPVITKETAYARLNSDGEDQPKQYASFIAYDWKNKIVKEISCDPKALSNYFTKSELPFETTPAFFRAEVLTKYKNDPEKYRVEERSIYCRGAWSLRSYDVNQAGQVHAYLCDLRDLPYEEQTYWKAFNEGPKAGISKRSFTNDFEGDWYLEYNPLDSLKQKIRQLHSAATPWWTLRTEELLDQVHYPVTTASEEFANEIMALDKLLNEGFNEKHLRSKAQELGQAPKLTDRSLLLVAACLHGYGFDEAHALEVVAPLREVARLRSKLKGHASGGEAAAIRSQMLAAHGSFRAAFEDLCANCDEAVKVISEAFQENGATRTEDK